LELISPSFGRHGGKKKEFFGCRKHHLIMKIVVSAIVLSKWWLGFPAPF
jgi:hypothetical protein